jgi:hypothetical protein
MIHDVIIPAREEKPMTLLPTIAAFRGWQNIGKIILVNDGLDDYGLNMMHDTMSVVKDVVITKGPGTGKGQAVMAGLPFVTARRIVLCDGDLHGFTRAHAEALAPVRARRMMIRGVTDPTPGHPPWPVREGVRPLVTGERSLPASLLAGLDLHGYAMEVQINRAAERARLPLGTVNLTGCRGTVRWTERRRAELKADGQWLRENWI